MQTPREILADLWTLAGGDPAALNAVTLTGKEPQLPRPDLPPRNYGDCAAGSRSMSRSTCSTPSSNVVPSATCASTASRPTWPGTPSPGFTKPAISVSFGCTLI